MTEDQIRRIIREEVARAIVDAAPKLRNHIHVEMRERQQRRA